MLYSPAPDEDILFPISYRCYTHQFLTKMFCAPVPEDVIFPSSWRCYTFQFLKPFYSPFHKDVILPSSWCLSIPHLMNLLYSQFLKKMFCSPVHGEAARAVQEVGSCRRLSTADPQKYSLGVGRRAGLESIQHKYRSHRFQPRCPWARRVQRHQYEQCGGHWIRRDGAPKGGGGGRRDKCRGQHSTSSSSFSWRGGSPTPNESHRGLNEF